MEALLLLAEAQQAAGAPGQALAYALAAGHRARALSFDGAAAMAKVAAAAAWLALGRGKQAAFVHALHPACNAEEILRNLSPASNRQEEGCCAWTSSSRPEASVSTDQACSCGSLPGTAPLAASNTRRCRAPQTRATRSRQRATCCRCCRW